MRCGSLFTGIGGLDLGLERAGMEIVWQCESDPFCRKVLARHWPGVPCYPDVWKLDGDVEPVDLLAGGFPCQPASNAGRRLGVDDERWLWPAFERCLRLLRPRLVLVENVPGLLVRGMGDLLGDLAALGYDAEWGCVPAAAVGAPHLRWRVFVVARLGKPSGALSDTEQHQLRVERQRRGQQHREPGPAEPGGDGAARPVADTNGGRLQVERVEEPGGLDRASRRQPDRRGALREQLDAENVADAQVEPERAGLRESRPRGVGWGRSGDGGGSLADTERERRHRRTAGLPEGQRTPPEAERDGWWAVEPDVGRVAYGVPARVDRLRALGNAVVPQVAELVGRRLLESL